MQQCIRLEAEIPCLLVLVQDIPRLLEFIVLREDDEGLGEDLSFCRRAVPEFDEALSADLTPCAHITSFTHLQLFLSETHPIFEPKCAL